MLAGSCDLVQQYLCPFQICCVMSFREPAVERGQQVTGLLPPACVRPQASEVGRRAEPQGPRRWIARDGQCPLECASPLRNSGKGRCVDPADEGVRFCRNMPPERDVASWRFPTLRVVQGGRTIGFGDRWKLSGLNETKLARTLGTSGL